MYFKSQYKKFLYNNSYIFLYLIFISLVSILSLYFSYILGNKFPYLIDKNNNIILSRMMFDYGELVNNIFYSKKYSQVYNGVESYLIRLPLLPFVTTFIGKISLNLYLFLLLKNIIFFSIYFLSALLFVQSRFLNKRLLILTSLLAIYFYNFYNITTTLNFFTADSYISIILPSLFLLLISNHNYRYIFISILLFFLYLSKTSMFFVTFICPFIFYMVEKKSKFYKRLLPLFFLVIAVVSWGSFGLIKTGTFPFGSKHSSSNQEGLSRILNSEFRNYYPHRSIDLIPFNKIDNIYKYEWEYFDHYKKNNLNYIKNNFSETFYGVLLKIKFIIFNYQKDGVFPDENGNYKNPVMISHILNRILGLLFIIILVKKIIPSFNFRNLSKSDIYILSLYLPFLFPYVVGWSTSKHLVPIFLVINIYLITELIKKKFNTL